MRIRPISLRLLLLIVVAGKLTGCSIFADGEDQLEDDLFDSELDNLATADQDTTDQQESVGDSFDTPLSSEGFGGDSLDSFNADSLVNDTSSPLTSAGTEIVTDQDAGFGAGFGMGMGIDSGMGLDGGIGMASGMPPAAPPMTNPNPISAASLAPGNAQVYYVSTGSTLVDSPSSSQIIGSVHTGDPVLVTISGQWANVLNRGWLKRSQLSQKPVGRSKANRTWE